jgi:K+-dependent Na+/Ca+ exchanger-like protein
MGVSTLSSTDKEITNSSLIEIPAEIDADTCHHHYACDGAKSGDLESSDRKRSNSSRTQKDVVVIETPFGCLRGKHQLRAAVQTGALGILLMGFGLFHVYSLSTGPSLSDAEFDQRFLEEATDSPVVISETTDCYERDPIWLVILYILGILYTFLALAIVCDEFFVPALEELSGPHRMNLSMDVAGATLMAAGGSAPELATSLIGTFKQSEIGFGTIVGSAVFNVLFVIGMCSLLANEVLTLTWWPLFRDTLYYTMGLIVLAVFTGYVSANQIELWEACVLFALYIGYIILMWQNQNLYMKITGKTLEDPEEDNKDIKDNIGDDDNGVTSNGSANGNNDDKTNGRSGMTKQSSKTSVQSAKSHGSHGSRLSGRHGSEHTTSGANYVHFLWQGNFRAGILKLLKDPDSWAATAGTGMVAKIIGDADHVFEQVDIDGNGHIDGEELQRLFDLLECHATPSELREVFVELDTNGDGVISRKEFTAWYCRSEERIMSQVQHVFDQIDVDKSNSIDKDELKTLLATLDPHVSDEDVQSALEEMYKHGDPNQITFEEFSDWYKQSLIYEKQKQLIKEDVEGVWENVCPPRGGSVREWVWYIISLPLVAALTLTIPDVQRPGNGKWCYVSFLISIAWIGGFSYFMVEWAEKVGKRFAIPDELMGLTVLAAGTSVPDLLSSVILARRGQGDMAVSSSVGSNIFDILVGLPVPWLIYSAVNSGDRIMIMSDGLVTSLLVLISMLVLVIVAIHCQGWKLTKILGGVMFLFYIGFLAQAIYFESPFEPETC